MLHAGHDRAETQGDDPGPFEARTHDMESFSEEAWEDVRLQRKQATMFWEMEDDDDA